MATAARAALATLLHGGSMPQPVYEVELRRAKLTVHLAELTVTQSLMAMRAPGTATAKGPASSGLAINAEALRMSIRSINGEAVKYAELQGDDLVRKLGRVRHVTALVSALNDIHVPTDDERAEIKRSAAISVDDWKEVWKVRLPANLAHKRDARTVTMAEVGLGDLGSAIAEAEASAKSEAAAALIGTCANIRRSIRSIDGQAIDGKSLEGKAWDATFTAKETRLLGYVYDLIHAGEEEIEVGEAKPVDGTR